MAIKMVIADDHKIFRDGFKVLLKKQDKVKLIGEAADGMELVQVVTALQPDVVITDIKMPGTDGVKACKIIRQEFPHIPVIALSMFNDDNLVLDMFDAGAAGYLLKNTNKEELLQAITAVLEGENYFAAATSLKLAKRIASSSRIKDTPEPEIVWPEKQLEVIRLICEQLSSKEIAARLNVSVRTVETHRIRIHEKTKTRNSVGIAIYAIKNKLFSIE